VENHLDNLVAIDCNNLKTGIINMDKELVKPEINKLLRGSVPIRINGDEIGHKKNLSLLINGLNSQCIEIHTELHCYACIDVLPALSELLVTTDSSGVIIRRIIDISTPSDDTLSYRWIHEVWH
jgi:hypothetical protein